MGAVTTLTGSCGFLSASSRHSRRKAKTIREENTSRLGGLSAAKYKRSTAWQVIGGFAKGLFYQTLMYLCCRLDHALKYLDSRFGVDHYCIEGWPLTFVAWQLGSLGDFEGSKASRNLINSFTAIKIMIG